MKDNPIDEDSGVNPALGDFQIYNKQHNNNNKPKYILMMEAKKFG